MKNLARASVFGSFVLAGLLATFACWPVAPRDAELTDAALVDLGDGNGVFLADSSAVLDASGGPDAGEDGGDGGADAIAPVLPYASTVIAAGIGFGCHIDAQGDVWCWGNNNFGQAGSAPSGVVVVHPQQVPLVAGTTATAIALGDYHACAVTSTNAVYCWGLNNSYQLGHTSASNGDLICPGAVAGQTVDCNPTPTLVDVPPAIAIAAAGAWTCTVGTDGAVECWGAVQAVTASGSTACGTGTAQQGGMCYPAPYAVSGISGVTQLAVAFDHACGLTAGNQVACWGYNNEGQVSPQGCPLSDCTPTADAGLPASTSVAVGPTFTCAILSDGGTVSCFGDNVYGELGHAPGTQGDLGTPAPDASGGVFNATPMTVGGLGAVGELVGAGNQAGCALVAAGVVKCWGNVGGDAGPGVPVAVAGLPAMNALGVPDSSYACGVANDKSIWCWNLGGGIAPVQVQ